MLEVLYIYGLILACVFVYKTLLNDPERESIWGAKDKETLLNRKEKEIELLRNQLEHYKSYSPAKEASREEYLV